MRTLENYGFNRLGRTALALVLGLGLAGIASTAGAAALYTSGHADIDIAYEAGEWELGYHFEGGIVDGVPVDDEEREASEIITLVPASTETPRPAGSAWDPLGVSA